MYVNKYQFFLLVLFLLAYVAFPVKLCHGQEREIGFIPVENFSQEQYGGLPQNWAVVQDGRGVIYVGNKDYLLEFDGEKWKKIFIGSNTDIRSLAIDEKGRIFIGAYADFGYIQPTKEGNLQFVSLKHFLKENQKDFADIWKTFCFNEKVIFQSNEKLFIYRYDTIHVIQAEEKFHNAFKVDSQLFVIQQNVGLMSFKNDQLRLFENGSFFANMRIYMLFKYNDNSMLVVTNKHGIFKITATQAQLDIEPFHTNFNDVLIQQQVYHGVSLANKNFSIGTFDGIEIMDTQGQLIYWLDKGMGLIDENIKYQYIDAYNNLWLALSNGISKVDIHSPVAFFNEKSNINGTIESITRYKNELYIATSVGIFYLKNQDILNHQPSQFLPVNNLNTETWIVKPVHTNKQSFLFAETNGDVLTIDANTKTPHTIFKGIPWAIHQSKLRPNLIYIGLEDGIQYMIYKNNAWKKYAKIPGVNNRIKHIAEAQNGELWLGTAANGIYKLTPSEPGNLFNTTYNIQHYDTSQNLAGGPYFPFIHNNEVIFGSGKGVFRYNRKNDQFELHQKFESALGNKPRYIYFISRDKTGNIWMNTYQYDLDKDELGYFFKDSLNKDQWISTPFKATIHGQINSIFHDSDSTTWLGGTEGLFRYDPSIQKTYEQEYHTLIREVRLGQDSTIFYGTYYDKNGYVSVQQPEELKYVLPFKYNSLIFEFAAQNTAVQHPLVYSFFLEGYDKKWSEWNEETKKEYTNLPEGEYRFRVKAKNVYDTIGKEAVFEFTITPPWYRTIVAYIGYVLGLIGFIYLIVTQYTKYLRQIIKENTAEIRAQKEEIETQKEEITDSIKYAQRIQKAICPSPERANELLPEHFVLWRPRDIVSGDYWWMTEKNGQVAIVAADCTGHGVPGAFMSMLGVSFLNEIVNKMDEMVASEILNQLRNSVKATLKQTGKEGEQKDGMDLALVIIDQENMVLQYAGAYNPLYLYRNGELLETKADKNPIGIYIKELDSFTNHVIELQKGDTFYTFSDGYVDQFGGEKGGKFKTKKFKQLLADIQHLSMKDQKEILNQTIDAWRGKIDQVDDIIVVGIRM